MRIYAILTGLSLLLACESSPKVITASNSEAVSTSSSGVFSSAENTTSTSPSADFNTVLIKEILPATRYVYLYVNNGKEDYWIATRKQPITQGARYRYRDGLLKTDFESKEHGRIFDKIYLVSNLIPLNEQVQKAEGFKPMVDESLKKKATAHAVHKDAISIASLIQNPAQYLNQEVIISGTCVKVNANIMSRNWIHIQDGTADDYDLVITSSDFIHEGAPVSMRATVHQDVDFGAGYRYDLILENGSVIR